MTKLFTDQTKTTDCSQCKRKFPEGESTDHVCVPLEEFLCPNCKEDVVYRFSAKEGDAYMCGCAAGFSQPSKGKVVEQ